MRLRNKIAVLGFCTLVVSADAGADSKAEIDNSVGIAFQQFNTLSPHFERIARNAAGILVFPQVTKGGVAVAGDAYGEGALQIKGRTVAYYSIISPSIGLTNGIERRNEIILFMTQEALDQFTSVTD
jgi:lipid-binding SYLF domain-containing protein